MGFFDSQNSGNSSGNNFFNSPGFENLMQFGLGKKKASKGSPSWYNPQTDEWKADIKGQSNYWLSILSGLYNWKAKQAQNWIPAYQSFLTKGIAMLQSTDLSPTISRFGNEMREQARISGSQLGTQLRAQGYGSGVTGGIQEAFQNKALSETSRFAQQLETPEARLNRLLQGLGLIREGAWDMDLDQILKLHSLLGDPFKNQQQSSGSSDFWKVVGTIAGMIKFK